MGLVLVRNKEGEDEKKKGHDTTPWPLSRGAYAAKSKVLLYAVASRSAVSAAWLISLKLYPNPRTDRM